jgi:hypothetical protein
LRQELQAVFNPFLAVQRSRTNEMRAAHAARDALVSACHGNIDQPRPSNRHWCGSLKN